MREVFDRRRQTIVQMLREIPGVECPEPFGRVLRLPVGQGRARQGDPRPAPRDQRGAVRAGARARPRSRSCPGEAFGTPGYVRMSYALGDDDLVEGVTRLHKLLAEAAEHRPDPCGLPDTRHAVPRVSESTKRAAGSPDAAEGPSAPALHRLAAAGDAARAGGRAPASGCPTRSTRWTARTRRSCGPPTSAAGSGSSGSTTPRARSCAARPTYAGWCGRRPRTTPREGSGWLEIQVDPTSYAPHLGGLTPAVELVLDAARAGCRGHRRRGRGDHRGEPHPAPAGRPHAGPAGRAVRRPRAWSASACPTTSGAAAPRTSPRRSGSPPAPGCCRCRTAASWAAPAASRPAWTPSAPTGSATASARSRTRRCWTGWPRPASRSRCVPMSNVRLGVYASAGRRAAAARCARPASPVALGADDPLLFGVAAARAVRGGAHGARLRRRGGWPSWRVARCAAPAAPDDVRARLLAGIDDWLAAPPPAAVAHG